MWVRTASRIRGFKAGITNSNLVNTERRIRKRERFIKKTQKVKKKWRKLK